MWITIIYSLWLCSCRLVQLHLFTFYKNRLQFVTINTIVIYSYYLYTIRNKLLTEINHWIRMCCFIWFGTICPYQTKLDMDLKLITIVSKLTPSLYKLIVRTMCFKLYVAYKKRCILSSLWLFIASVICVRWWIRFFWHHLYLKLWAVLLENTA